MKKVLITGGSGGLGRTIAKELSKDYKVCIAATDEEKLKIVSKALNCDYCVCDVSDHTQVEEMVKRVGKVDVLINCAGLWIQEELDLNDYAKIQEVVNVNLLGVINCTKACLPSMKKSKSGHIININSKAGISHKQERVVYYASKWGVTGFSKSLEDEVKKYGIKVTDILLGKLKTRMKAGISQTPNVEEPITDGLDSKEVAKLITFILNLPKDVNIPEVAIKNIVN